MKEFIDKLISRLEEEKQACHINAEVYTERKIGKIIEIVNQLAEEYKHCTLCYLQSPCEYQNENAILPNELLADENGWIPCSERLPKESHDYLICDDKGNVYSSTYHNNRWLVNFATDEVIAWQPLPPKFVQKGE